MPAYRTRDASARSKSSSSSAHRAPTKPRSSPTLLPATKAALEVSTDAPAPPTVSIISPTPRAFTFPINDTRFPNSPSSSPFELNLKSIPATPPPLRSFSPTSSIGSDSSLSVLSSPTAPPPSQASSHRRRRSTASDIGERRPRKGDDDYVKRPENAFILFRRKMCEERQAALKEDGSTGPVKKERQADLSKTISQKWKSLPAEERQYWVDLAMTEKKKHEAMHPDYVYRPQRTKDKKGKKGKGQQDTDSESLSFRLPISSHSRSLSRNHAPGSYSQGHGRRAVSAPTPPPYQSIQLPSVWMPSSPTSPTLLPRISRRSPGPPGSIPPPTESAPLTTFDYASNDSLFMPPYPPGFDGNLQHSDVYQNMFQIPEHAGIPDGPLLHAFGMQPHDAHGMGPNVTSPANSIASNAMSPADTYPPGLSPSSSHGGPFTATDALRLMSLAQQKNMPDNVDDNTMNEMPYGFWPGETLWANMESLMPDDFNLGSIPPVELGLAQFEAMPQQPGSARPSSSSLSGAWQFDAPDRERVLGTQTRPEEHDKNDAGPPDEQNGFSALFTHDW